jgi:hypothetical protein
MLSDAHRGFDEGIVSPMHPWSGKIPLSMQFMDLKDTDIIRTLGQNHWNDAPTLRKVMDFHASRTSLPPWAWYFDNTSDIATFLETNRIVHMAEQRRIPGESGPVSGDFVLYRSEEWPSRAPWALSLCRSIVAQADCLSVWIVLTADILNGSVEARKAIFDSLGGHSKISVVL